MAEELTQVEKDKRLGIGFSVGSVALLLMIIACFVFLAPAVNPVVVATNAASDAINSAGTTIGNTVSGVEPSKVVLTSAKGGKKKVTLVWKAAENASGYQIYIRAKGSKEWKYEFDCVPDSSTAAKVESECTGLKSKKKYEVKVRAYSNSLGGSSYGKWSKTDTFKTK